MKITIKGNPKEIAALAMELQERRKSNTGKEKTFITSDERADLIASIIKSYRQKNDILFPRERNPEL
ncbi:MAG: hypothetical protein NC084_09765 [Bacteroides sp.]|nr:hypothetical protein [Eubacterium sp.]MCM1419429.1 hypothetical protein [Roseburia sp.]MCM1462984.1 hypothetical protein [Bacteroides sp.]